MSHSSKENVRLNKKLNVFLTIFKMALSLVVMIALTVIVSIFNIPNPNMILITGLTVFTTIYGYRAGIVCGLEMLVYSMYFFSENHSFINYTDINLQKIIVIFVGTFFSVLFIGNLKKRRNEAERKLIRMNEELQRDFLFIEEASIKDDVTGIKNRYALRSDYGEYKNKNLLVMMMDIDGFNKLNEALGKSVGDYLLIQVAKNLKNYFGEEYSYRYENDKFLIICSEISKESFINSINKTREALRLITLDNKPMPMNFSAGFVYGAFEEPQDLRLMIRQAEVKMYEVKNQGGNSCFDEPFSRERAEHIYSAKSNVMDIDFDL